LKSSPPPFAKSDAFLGLHLSWRRKHRPVRDKNVIANTVFTYTVTIPVLHVDRVKRRLRVARVRIVESEDLRGGGGVVDGNITFRREPAGVVNARWWEAGVGSGSVSAAGEGLTLISSLSMPYASNEDISLSL